MDRTLTAKQVEEIIKVTALSIQKLKAKWLDDQMKRIMPPELYALKKTKSGKQQMKLSKWISTNKVSLKEHPMTRDVEDKIITLNGTPNAVTEASLTEMVMGNNVISEFRVRHKGGKIETMSRDYPLELSEDPTTCS